MIVIALLQRDEATDGLAGYLMRLAHYCGFRHGRMFHQGRLDLHGAKTVAGNVHDVVDAAENPVVAVLVTPGSVTGEVCAGDARPVLIPIALRVSPDRAEHRRPRTADNQEAFAPIFDGVSIKIDDLRHYAWHGERG